MTDDIIKKILNDNNVKYKLTSKSFIIPREKKMSNDKAPKWFAEFATEQKEFNKRIESKVDKNAEMILENKEMINHVITRVDNNTNMILKAHPEFKK